MRKLMIALSISLALVIAFLEIRTTDSPKPGETGMRSTPTETPAKDSGRPTQNRASAVTKVATPHRPWRSFSKLSSSEQEEFHEVAVAVKRLHHWGRMADGEIDQVRNTMSTIGDRGLADYGRHILAVKSGDKLTKDQAKDILAKLDTLSYAADAGWDVANEALAELAYRPISLDTSGNMLDSASAYLTLEAIELAAKSKPDEVRGFVESQDVRLTPAYAYHFIIGRRMAGRDLNQAIVEAKSSFGDQAVTIALAAK